MVIKESRKIVKSTPIKYKCDYCGKEVVYDYDVTGSHTWHHFTTGHNEWSNDSVDSIESFDVCSSECYWSVIKDQLNNLEDYKDSAYLDNMSYSFAKELVGGIFKQKDD